MAAGVGGGQALGKTNVTKVTEAAAGCAFEQNQEGHWGSTWGGLCEQQLHAPGNTHVA